MNSLLFSFLLMVTKTEKRKISFLWQTYMSFILKTILFLYPTQNSSFNSVHFFFFTVTIAGFESWRLYVSDTETLPEVLVWQSTLQWYIQFFSFFCRIFVSSNSLIQLEHVSTLEGILGICYFCCIPNLTENDIIFHLYLCGWHR